MEIVMKKMETFCPRKEHLTMVAAISLDSEKRLQYTFI